MTMPNEKVVKVYTKMEATTKFSICARLCFFVVFSNIPVGKVIPSFQKARLAACPKQKRKGRIGME